MTTPRKQREEPRIYLGPGWPGGEDIVERFEKAVSDESVFYREHPELALHEDPARSAMLMALLRIQEAAIRRGAVYGAEAEASDHAAHASSSKKIDLNWEQIRWKWDERRGQGDSFGDADVATALRFDCSWRFIQNLRLKAGVRAR